MMQFLFVQRRVIKVSVIFPVLEASGIRPISLYVMRMKIFLYMARFSAVSHSLQEVGSDESSAIVENIAV